MAQLTITFKYFSAFVNHADGTSVFLPTTGHTARISGSGLQSTPLVGTTVEVVRRPNSGAVHSGAPQPADGGYLTQLTCALETAGRDFDMGRLTAPVVAAQLNARFSLPWGRLTDAPMGRADFKDTLWDFGNGCRSKATDTVTYTLNLPDAEFELAVGSLRIPLSDGGSFTVTNGDTDADEQDCAPGALSDPYAISEFPDLVSALGLNAPQVPTGDLPASLRRFLESAMAIRLCRPCPHLQLNIF